MKQLLFILACFLLLPAARAQYIHKIKADSVRITNDSCNAELILENSTRKTSGFLFNKGNGRTEFRKALLKLNDSAYLIGGDTLFLKAGNLIDTSQEGQNIFYVSKKYTGAAGAIITGMGKANIGSSNQSYLHQLSKAVPGSIMNTFPDPFSARNVALDYIAQGKITKAVIIVLSGNGYTVGSDNPMLNGSTNYVANSNVVADVGFSQSNGTQVASLCQNNIDYYFEQSTQLHYINSTYTVWMSYQEDLGDNYWNSGIFGDGFFKQYYGQKQGFTASWCKIDNANASFTFEAKYLELQYYRGFTLTNVSNFHIDINRIQSGYVILLETQLARNGDGKNVFGYFNCDNLVYGQGRIQNSYDDIWSAFVLGDVATHVDSSLRVKNLSFRIGNADLKVACPEYDDFFQAKGLNNANIDLAIGNLYQTSASIAYANATASLIGCPFSTNNNVIMNVDIKNAVTEYLLFGMLKNSCADPLKQSYFTFNCDLHRKKPSLVITADWAKRNINIQNDYVTNTIKAKMVISGNYINESNSEVVAMDCTHMSKLTELRGYFKTTAPGKNVMILNGYQNKRFALVDATLINDGTVPCIALKGSQNGFGTLGGIPLNSSRTIYVKNVHANTAPDTNVNTTGDSIRVVSDLNEYF